MFRNMHVGVSVLGLTVCAMTPTIAVSQALFITPPEAATIPLGGAAGITADGTLAVTSRSAGLFDLSGRYTPVEVAPDDRFGPVQSLSASDISRDGRVVVGTARVADGYVAFRAVEGGPAELRGDLVGGTLEAFAIGVSGDGRVIVGSGSTDSGRRAFRWTEQDGFETLGSLSGSTPGSELAQTALNTSHDGSVIVGESSRGNGFRWTAETGALRLRTNSISRRSRARGVSGDGRVVVGVISELGRGDVPAIWTPNQLTLLATQVDGWRDGPDGGAQSANEDGSVIVGYMTVPSSLGPTLEAFRWTPAGGLRLFSELLEDETGFDVRPGSVYVASSVSEDGTRIAVALNETLFGPSPQLRTRPAIIEVPLPCSRADLAAPIGLHSHRDVVEFVERFVAADRLASEIAEPLEESTVADIDRFVELFFQGCPAG